MNYEQHLKSQIPISKIPKGQRTSATRSDHQPFAIRHLLSAIRHTRYAIFHRLFAIC